MCVGTESLMVGFVSLNRVARKGPMVEVWEQTRGTSWRAALRTERRARTKVLE